jgi:putative two-component system response regulator
MRIYSHLLAAQLRYSPYAHEIDDMFLDNLLRASALHDIGKVGIPDSLLRKPGRFTAEERLVMNRHTIDGERILRRLATRTSTPGYFEMAAQIARSHHERFDGAGYPDGLRGHDIPLAARIVKVADVFDALTTVRPYKESLRPELATEVILRGRGTEFDPVVVDAMMAVLDEFYEICPLELESAPAPLTNQSRRI